MKLTHSFNQAPRRNVSYWLVRFLIISVFLISCEEKTLEHAQPEVYWTPLQDKTFDYLGVSKAGEIMAVKKEHSNDQPVQMYYKNGNHPGFTLFLDNQGYPSEGYYDDHYFIYGNLTPGLIHHCSMSRRGITSTTISWSYDLSELLDFTKTNQLIPTQTLRWGAYAIDAAMSVSKDITRNETVINIDLKDAFIPDGIMITRTIEGNRAVVGNAQFNNVLLEFTSTEKNSLDKLIEQANYQAHRSEIFRSELNDLIDKYKTFLDTVPHYNP